MTEPDSRIFVTGRVSIGRDENASLLADSLRAVDNIRKELWIAFDDLEAYKKESAHLEDILFEHQGHTPVVIYLRKEKAIKRLSRDLSAAAGEELLTVLGKILSPDNVKIRVLGL